MKEADKMKKLVFFAVFLFIASVFLVLGTAGGFGNGVGSPNNECRNNGFDFGIAKWEWNVNSYKLSREGEAAGYSTSVTGTARTAQWTSSPGAAGVLSKEGKNTYSYFGPSGTVVAGKHDISHVTLCGSVSTCGNGAVDSEEEECDDGNTICGDGCDEFCHIEMETDICGDNF